MRSVQLAGAGDCAVHLICNGLGFDSRGDSLKIYRVKAWYLLNPQVFA
jgi:hypothetical protein